MEEKIKELQQQIEAYTAKDKAGVEDFSLKYISKKGIVGELFERLKQVPVDQKKTVGKLLNELKQAAEAKLVSLNESMESSAPTQADIDLTLPPVPNKTGNLHPLSLTKYRIIEIFERLGFNVADGPEI